MDVAHTYKSATARQLNTTIQISPLDKFYNDDIKLRGPLASSLRLASKV